MLLHEHWFRRLKNGFLKDKDHSGQLGKFQDEELEVLLDYDQCQFLIEMPKVLNVTDIVVPKQLKYTGMSQKYTNWVPYQLKPRVIEKPV